MAVNGWTYDTGLQFVQWAETGQEDAVENITGNDRYSALRRSDLLIRNPKAAAH